MAVLERQRFPPDHDLDTEALFKEARRRRLRRLWCCAGVLLAGAACAGYVATRHRPVAPVRPPTHEVKPTNLTPRTTNPVAPGIELQHPYGLAVAPNGTVYLLDTGRNQILERSPSGGFQVVAGTGQRGFAGDGGPAIDAVLNLEPNSAVVIASDGALFFSDSGNGRVREVEPDGTMETVAGGGPMLLGTAPVSALQASFGGEGPTGLAIGPDGDLYIGATAVYQLTDGGTLQWVVGEPGNTPGFQGISANPAAQQDFSPATRLAFDGQGDLLVAGGGGFGLYEDSATGNLSFVENFRGDGAWGSMAALPDGDVALSDRDGLSVFQPSGTITAVPGNLSALLGPMKGSQFSNTFIGGDGVSAGPNSALYVDTDTGNTFTSVNALIEVGSDGTSPKVLWKS